MKCRIFDIRKDPNNEKLHNHLDEFYGTNIILYNNVKTNLKIEHHKININNVSTMIYSDECGYVIFLSNDTSVTSKSIVEYFENKNYDFNVINFTEAFKKCEYHDSMPELCFANNFYSAKNAFLDSKTKNIDNCICIKNVPGSIKFFYYNPKNKQQIIYFMNFNDIFLLDDKYIFPATYQKYGQDSCFDQIKEIAEKCDVNIKKDKNYSALSDLLEKYEKFEPELTDEDCSD